MKHTAKKRALVFALILCMALSLYVSAFAESTIGYHVTVPFEYTDADRFKDGLAMVQKKVPDSNGSLTNLWGFIDINNNMVVPAIYDDAQYFYEGGAIVRLDGKYGLTDKTGNVTAPLTYDDAKWIGADIFEVKIGDKFGCINSKGSEIVPVMYDKIFRIEEAGSSTGNFIAVVDNSINKLGLYNTSGKQITPIKYQHFGVVNAGTQWEKCFVILDGKLGLIDINGNEAVPMIYDSDNYEFAGTEWDENEAFVLFRNYISVCRDGKYGVIELKTNEIIIPVEYDLKPQYAEGMFMLRKDKMYSFFDPVRRVTIPNQYDKAGAFTSDGLAMVKSDYAHGYIDKTGKEAVPLKYYDAKDFYEGLAAVADYEDYITDDYSVSQKKWFYIDTSGNRVTPGSYDSAENFVEGRAVVKIDGKAAMIDTKGNFIIQPGDCTDLTKGADDDGYFRGTFYNSARDTTTYVWFDETGKETGRYEKPANYMIHGGFTGGFVTFDDGMGHEGYLNPAGEVAIPPMYKAAHPFYYDYAQVLLDGSGNNLIDKNGEYLFPFFYEYAMGYMNFDHLEIMYDGKIGIFDKQRGKLIAPIEFIKVFDYSYQWLQDGMFMLGLEDERGSIMRGFITFENPLYTASDWAKDTVTRAWDMGLIPDGEQASYQKQMTRAEFCALAAELYEEVMGHEITQRAQFSDTDDINVQKMAGLGIVQGVGDGLFDPDGLLNREQAAVILAKLSAAMGHQLPASASTFSDNAAASDWALDSIGQMQAAKIMNGTGNNEFSPAAPYTREQSIMTIMTLYDYIQ